MASSRVSRIVRQLRGGQITIPAEFRRALGIDDEAYLQITLGSGEIRIKPLRVADDTADPSWLKDLYDHFAPAREEAAKYVEEQINTDIDRAIQGVRHDRASRRL